MDTKRLSKLRPLQTDINTLSQSHTASPRSPMHPSQTASSTPVSSPGLFNPANLPNRPLHRDFAPGGTTSPQVQTSGPLLHPLQHHVRETHKAHIDSDTTTGRKFINQYEVLEEIGRGMHGKVKLARDSKTGDNVAIKIIPRFSKKRRLGKVTAMSQQDKTKKEIAILKKIRHPDVVALLEIIDDPELQKIYMVLEHVELGEIVWRKKGLPHICQYERRRIERATSGDPLSPEEEKYNEILERRQVLKEQKRAKMSRAFASSPDYWSMEHGAGDDFSVGSQSRIPSQSDLAVSHRSGASMPKSLPSSWATSRALSRSHSVHSLARTISSNVDGGGGHELHPAAGDADGPGSNPTSVNRLEGTMYGSHASESHHHFRARSPSMADSIISHMSSVDFHLQPHDPYADDYSYVPCFTIENARTTFRDTVLGLEYLHYQGVVHRDIKPANLLWTKDHRVKISDFGVSYFGRPIRDGESGETVTESEAKDFDNDLELAKTVGTPAFFAPELCYTDPDKEVQPKVSEQIDVWSLGVTLYCLIYARIPFLAEDEFQMFRKIANDPVYIPRRRLRPVDPATSPSTMSLYKRRNSEPYRDDNELLYEDIDELLEDLLRRMLTKDPEKRIRLREIKRHPWVVEGIPDLLKWLDETDPARPSLGRKIQVNEKDLSDAVVPLNFLQRARSAVRKAVGKVIQPLTERGDSRVRRRATSSVNSSCGDALTSGPHTPLARATSRPSFGTQADASVQATGPGSSSQPATPRELASQYDPLATVLGPPSGPQHPHADPEPRRVGSPGFPFHRMSSTPPPSYRPSRHSHTKSIDPSYLTTIPDVVATSEVSTTNVARTTRAVPLRPYWDASSRTQSVDASLLRTKPLVKRDTVSLLTKHLRPQAGPAHTGADAGSAPSPSPLPISMITGARGSQHYSDPDMYNRRRSMVEGTVRPPATRRISLRAEMWSQDGYGPESPVPGSSPSDRTVQPSQGAGIVQSPTKLKESKVPSSTEGEMQGGGPTQDNAASSTTVSSRSGSMDTVESPLSTPGDHMSPNASRKTSSANVPSEQILAFQSDPSLPALLSGASSVSADLEGELLCRPGVVNRNAALLETSDSLTPPADAKEPLSGFPLEETLVPSQSVDSGIVSMPTVSRRHYESETESDSDSEDEGLTMMSNRRASGIRGPLKSEVTVRRRDTNASLGSTETAKETTLLE